MHDITPIKLLLVGLGLAASARGAESQGLAGNFAGFPDVPAYGPQASVSSRHCRQLPDG